MKKMQKFPALVLAGALTLGSSIAGAQQGVSDDEVVIGSHGDLSGPFAAFGAPAIRAAQLYFDRVNAAGGVHGRKIRFVVEDHGYQVPKAVQAINKLVSRDRIFAMLLGLGTPMNMASFKVLERKGIPNLYPLSAARQMVSEPKRLRFVGGASYYDSVRAALGHMVESQPVANVCAMYIPSDFGKEIQLAAKDEAAAHGIEYAAETTHKPDETDYVGSLAKLREAGCELVAVALSVRGVITAVGTAKKLGWDNVRFLGSSAAFHGAVAKVPGGITEGFHVGASWSDLEARADRPAEKAWIEQWKAATGENFPGTGALLGNGGALMLHRALEAAGRDLTLESFLAAMESLEYDDPIMGNRIRFSADEHVGAKEIYISRVEGGQWKVVGTATAK